MEVPMINWPTAFVIAVAMICGAVLINKPSDAAFGGDGGMIAASGTAAVWQLKDGEVRLCQIAQVRYVSKTVCFPWSD
jgi:hypothetical protein